MKVKFGVLEILEDMRRKALFRATEEIHSEQLAGILFGAGLVLTDHVFNAVRVVASAAKT